MIYKFISPSSTPSFADKLEGVESYVGELLQHLKDEVPEASFPRSTWSTTPFMWFATAGMRLLETKTADDLTNKLREVGELYRAPTGPWPLRSVAA